MQSKATTVAAYLQELPAERRALLNAVRKVIRANMDKGLEEVMNYGMIGYVIPHKIYPAGYHCDPSKPFPYGGLASQKNYCSLYLFPVYAEAENWFRDEWKKGGKKLDMGKCCIRFKTLEDLDLDVLARALKRFTVTQTLQTYERLLGSRAKNRPAQAKAKPAAAKSKPAAAKSKPAAAKSKPAAAKAKSVRVASGKPTAEPVKRAKVSAAANSGVNPNRSRPVGSANKRGTGQQAPAAQPNSKLKPQTKQSRRG
jgi:hypothetical protein